jgi:hypothetical protein
VYSRVILLAPMSALPDATYHIGLSGTTNPRVQIGRRTSTQYGAVHVNTAGTIVSAATVDYSAAAAGDVLECAAVFAATGQVTASLARNHGAASSATGANPSSFPTAWGAQTLQNNATGVGSTLLTHTTVLAGSRSLAECRAAAGVQP